MALAARAGGGRWRASRSYRAHGQLDARTPVCCAHLCRCLSSACCRRRIESKQRRQGRVHSELHRASEDCGRHKRCQRLHMAEKIFILYGCTSRKLAEAKPAMGAIDACRRAIGLPQTSPDAAGAAMEGQMDLGKHLQDLLQRNVAQITNNLRRASSHAAQLCQQAFMQPPNCAPLLAVSPAAGWALGVSPSECWVACPVHPRLPAEPPTPPLLARGHPCRHTPAVGERPPGGRAPRRCRRRQGCRPAPL